MLGRYQFKEALTSFLPHHAAPGCTSNQPSRVNPRSPKPRSNAKSRFDVNREVNNGRGPVAFKISMGLDKTLIEFKLAKSSSLKRNMENQVEVYKRANGTDSAVFVVIAYSAKEVEKTKTAVKDLGLNRPDMMEVVIIDASPKESASKV